MDETSFCKTLKGPSQFSNMKFSQLENFVNIASVSIKDYDVQFLNQAREINEIFATVGNNDIKCADINRNLNYLCHGQNIIELNIQVTETYLGELEKKVIEMEEKTGDFCCAKADELDSLRRVFYPILLNLQETMTLMIHKQREIVAKLKVNKCEEDLEGQGKMAVEIMDNQLKQLEHLDILMKNLTESIQEARAQFLRGGLLFTFPCPCCQCNK